MATGFDSPKVKVLVNDGVEFVRGTKNKYDVIITDSSDPVGPAEVLYQQNYFRLIFEALKPGGIMCLQGNFPQQVYVEPWVNYFMVRRTLKKLRILSGCVLHYL